MLAWPTSANPVATRLGYTVSPAAYLPAASANGITITLTSGSARVYAGTPAASSHTWLTDIGDGDSYQVSGIASDQVISVQSNSEFSYSVTPTAPVPPPDPVTPPPDPVTPPPDPVTPPPSDPPSDPADPADPPAGGGGSDPGVIVAVRALWRCNTIDCSGTDWTGAVVNWPSWAAYPSNGRSFAQSRSVFAADGTPLYPYMGAWAQGCQVTGVTGTAAIIEWQRGTNTWRETLLQPGDTHVIDLHSPEDGAMIEGVDGSPGFSVRLSNCTPQPLP